MLVCDAEVLILDEEKLDLQEAWAEIAEFLT